MIVMSGIMLKLKLNTFKKLLAYIKNGGTQNDYFKLQKATSSVTCPIEKCKITVH